MGNTFCNDCKNTKSSEICCVGLGTVAQPTFKIPSHLEQAFAPQLPQNIIVRLASLEGQPLRIPKCGLIGLEQLPPYKNTLDDSVYEGEWLNGKPQGIGKVSYSSGQYLEGEFHQGHPCGLVRIFYLDGSYFQGQVVDYLATGTAKFTSEKLRFQGVFEGSKPQSGIINTKDRIQITFEFSTSRGSIQWPNRRKYTGGLCRKLAPSGSGRLVMEDGVVLDAEWREGHVVSQSRNTQEAQSGGSKLLSKQGSSRSSNSNKLSKSNADPRQGFQGVVNNQVQEFIRAGIPEIPRLFFSCQ